MSKINYYQWLNGNDCCEQHNDCGCHDMAYDYDAILLEISKLHTDDLILQDEIDELSVRLNGCCGQTGGTFTRWITMAGENDYWCSGTTKYSKEKEQSSTDGINWEDTGNIRNGSTILEENSVDCGYIPPTPGSYKAKIVADGTTYTISCNNSNVLTYGEVKSVCPNKWLITSVEIGDCTTEIGDRAFSATNLSSVTIHNSVTNIGNNAFENCINLSNINIPDSVTNIGEKAFYNCSLRELNVGNGVTTIGDRAFGANSLIEGVTIGSGVTSIGEGAFGGSFQGSIFICLATTPPILGWDVFSEGSMPTIYVPAESLEAYKEDRQWMIYADRIEAIP